MRIPVPSVPCVFVGPGTGIAPIRAMIEQRIRENATGTPSMAALIKTIYSSSGIGTEAKTISSRRNGRDINNRRVCLFSLRSLGTEQQLRKRTTFKTPC